MQIKNQLWTAVLWLALAAIFLSACSSTTSQNSGTVDFDQMFINMMVPHHQAAVEMAKIAQQRAEHPEIKQMADAVISGQQEEITQMKDWKKQWNGSSDTPPMSAMPLLGKMAGMDKAATTMNMQAEVDQLKNAAEPFDLAFIDSMIPHHQSAIDAAKMALTQAQRPQTKDLAQKIIDAQQKEIDQMTTWRTAWYPDAAPAKMPLH